MLQRTDDGYNVLVQDGLGGIDTFPSYADHPNILVQLYNKDGTSKMDPLRGVPLKSTAAGRYQQMYKWWPVYKQQLKLADFGPVSQDLVAIQHLRECKALDFFQQGKPTSAFVQANKIWASLPGSPYGQPTKTMKDVVAAYQRAGGQIA